MRISEIFLNNTAPLLQQKSSKTKFPDAVKASDLLKWKMMRKHSRPSPAFTTAKSWVVKSSSTNHNPSSKAVGVDSRRGILVAAVALAATKKAATIAVAA